jgi:hypothetical protein
VTLPAFEVNGTPAAPVPEPPVLVLRSLGAAVLLGVSLRKSRAAEA